MVVTQWVSEKEIRPTETKLEALTLSMFAEGKQWKWDICVIEAPLCQNPKLIAGPPSPKHLKLKQVL